jgi:hypothetical protein
VSGPATQPSPEVDRVLEAGEALREALAGYRTAFDEAARALGRVPVESPRRRYGFERLRADWETTVAAFRQAVDRIGTAQKTLARGR